MVDFSKLKLRPRVAVFGTEQGMWPKQYIALKNTFLKRDPREIHHGDLVGTHAQVDVLCKRLGWQDRICIHPPIKTERRAYCNTRNEVCRVRPAQKYADCTGDMCEVCRNGGTAYVLPYEFVTEWPQESPWHAARYCMDQGIKFTIIWPDGVKEQPWMKNL